ncbi:unnamed protein product [Adineta steineri]|uniref:E3 ubiquitin-protein ligase n=1 Tax=Adineta steineri TaxID=433720 RepID=A0A814LYE4_9BILA|nr:unnamed protein product [Adineta steineri]CAF3878449.1 unnamed protein product [Adineta steineri]
MSDQRRTSSRTCVTKKTSLPTVTQNVRKTANKSRKINHQTSSDTNSATRRHESPDIQNSTKRTRLDSVNSNKLNHKKQKDVSYNDVTDDSDIEEILPEKKHLDKTEIDRCAICLDDCTEPKQLDKCTHIFCAACIDQYFKTIKPQCPCCFTIYGEIRGNQPLNGTMTIDTSKHRLPGFEHDSRGTIRIVYHFPNGIQDESHPNPGTPYHGTTRTAYLPENREGRHVLSLLQKAFELQQIFTVGQSRTTGYDNVITWNDIHHKTNVNGGMENFGYPDKTYLNRVKQELAAKGIK